MQQRKLGKTGLTVSELGFGGWAIGGDAFGNSYGPTDDDESRAAIRRALELGITIFDTADIYGHGHSEALLSEVLRDWDGPPPIIVTKGGINFYRGGEILETDWTPYGVARSVQNSLIRQRRDALDVFLLMNPPVEELDKWRVWETLAALKTSGKIKNFGVSVAEPSDGVWLLKNHKPVAVLEVAYSLFYQGATVELLDLAQKRNVAVLAREPLANGFLTGKYAADSRFPSGDIRAALPPEYLAAMSEMTSKLAFLAADNSRTPTQSALRFVLDDSRVSSVIVGAKTARQIEENVGACDVRRIDENERKKVMKVFDE